MEREIAAPDKVEVLDVERGDNHGVLDSLVVGPDHSTLDGLARPQHRGDFVWLVAGLDLVGDDAVSVMACSTWLTVEDRMAADRLEDVVGLRAEDKQVPLAGPYRDLVRAIFALATVVSEPEAMARLGRFPIGMYWRSLRTRRGRCPAR